MKYDAFISYRHLEKDMFVAKGIHKALETTKVPFRIRKEIGKKKIERVFRDQEELPIGASLSDNIESALADSEFLVVICSPQTRESAWVMKEIDTFIAMHGKQNILAVLVEGEPADSFPRQLLTDDFGNPREPLAADVRGDSKREIRKKIKSESLRLAAAILYCDYDTLRQRHRERIMRRYTAIAAGVAALGVLFGMYNAYNLARINENYKQKLTNESKVLAATSRQVLEEGDRRTAALIALEALPGEGNDRPIVPDAMYALSEALGSYSIGYDLKKDKLLTHDVSVNGFVTNTDNTRVLSVDDSYSVYYWDVKSGERLFKKNTVYYQGDADRVLAVGINDAACSVATNHFLTGYDEAGNVVYDRRFDEDYIVFATYSKNGNYVGLSFGETAAVYDARTGKEVKSFQEDGKKFSADMIFSDNEKLFGIETKPVDEYGISDMDAPNAFLTLYDLESDKKVEFVVAQDSILDMYFTPDDYLIISSMNLDELLGSDDSVDSVQKFDYRTGEVIWNTEVGRSHKGIDSSSTSLKARIIDTSEGKKGEVLVSSSRNLYNLDLYTGEINTVFTAEDDIVIFYLNPDNELVNVGLSSGKIDIVDAGSGYNYADYAVEVCDEMTYFKVGSGYVLAKQYLSPDIVVMSYLEDESKEVILESDTNISNIYRSPEGKHYFYTLRGSGDTTISEVHVCDATTDEEISVFSLEGISSSDISYYDEETMIATSSDKGLRICHIDSGEVEMMAESEEGDYEWVFSGDKKTAVAVHGKQYKRYDLENKKFIDEGNFSEEIGFGYWNGGVINKTGDKMYYWDLDGQLFYYDFETGELNQIFENYMIKSAVCSEDGSEIVLECGDGFARVADPVTMEILDEVSYFGGYNRLLEFSEDGKRLFLQGSDYYFRIYDLENDKYVFISDDQWNRASYTLEIPDKNLLLFADGSEMIFIDLDTYGIMGRAEYGALYFEDTGKIISFKDRNLYKFTFKSLEDLVREAKEKYPNAELTPEQRLKYKLY